MLPKLFPTVFTQTLPGGDAPLNTGWCFLPEDLFPAHVADHPGFIRKDFHFGAAGRAPVQFHFQPPGILSGTLLFHEFPPGFNDSF
jgi:hypothetical protein